YYACSVSQTPYNTTTDDYMRCKAVSQLCGWIFLIIVVTTGGLVICCVRCLDSKTYLEAHYADVHKFEEITLLEEKMKEIARSEIEKNLTTLFKNNNVPKKVTWDKIAAVNSEDEDKTYYTPLHKWGTENKSEDRKPDEQVAQNPV
ncbi:hypothetical protein TNIN_282041, partial [Trichonephila inaurata madagascariensis]